MYQLFASLIGAAMANGNDQEAMALRKQATAMYGGISLPQLDQMVAQQLPPDAAQRYSASTAGTQAEGSAVGDLQSLISDGGETPQDKAAYVRAGVQAGGIENSMESAALRNLASRGLSGSAIDTATEGVNSQNAADKAYELSTQEASDAANRRLGAISQLGSLGSSMRGQELSAMQSQDAINKFNASQRTNADMYNLGLPQQQFGNEMQLTNAKANSMNGLATAYNDQAGRTATQAAGAGTAAQAAFGGGSSSMSAPNGPVPAYSDPSANYQQSSGSVYGNPDEWEKYPGG